MGIEVITRGWDRHDWIGAFYPADLPENWRLSYFATTFHAVLVPLALWHRADPDVLAQWALDVPEGFGFYLETTPGAPDPHQRRLAEPLGPRFRGWVTQARGQTPDLPAWRPGGGALLARQAPEDLIATPKAALSWLTALAADAGRQEALAVLTDGPADGVRRWEDLILLAGLA
jgi:hypothetical protein